MGQTNKSGFTLPKLLCLQGAVLIYTLSSTMSKLAAGAQGWAQFVLLYGAELGLLGVYALVWQQILKRVPVSVAYANRATNIIWAMCIAAVFFRETVTLPNIAGAVLVLAGTVVVDSDG